MASNEASSDIFTSALQKIDRAQFHISDLEGQFSAFIARKPHRFGIKHDAATGQQFVQIRFVEPVPSTFAVVVGDAVHNLRCSLDHMLWALIGWDNGTQDKHLKFPFRNNRENYKAACGGFKTPSAWIPGFLEKFEAFPRGRGQVFCALNDLDNIDKHRAIQPLLRATTHPTFTVYREGAGPIRMGSNAFIGAVGELLPILDLRPGDRVELDGEGDCAPRIFLSDVWLVEVFIAMQVFTESARNALKDFKSAVTEHPKT